MWLLEWLLTNQQQAFVLGTIVNGLDAVEGYVREWATR